MLKSEDIEIARLNAALKGWILANGPGGWIDNLRAENAKLIYQRDAITNLLEEECAENTKLRNEITRLRGEL